MRLPENIYRIIYKDGTVKEIRAVDICIRDGNIYIQENYYPFNNKYCTVGTTCSTAEHIEKIELLGKAEPIEA